MKTPVLFACFAACATCLPAMAMDPATAAALQRDLGRVLAAGKSKPAPASALLTDPGLQVDLVHSGWRGRNLTLVVLRDSSATGRLLGLVSRPQAVGPKSVSYHWFPGTAKTCQPQALDLAAVEHLFRIAWNDEPTQSYRFAAAHGSTSTPAARLTHAQLLTRIAEARECTAVSLRSATAVSPKPWRTLSLSLESSDPYSKRVVARLVALQGPVAGATILFTRAPHLECSGTTDRTGYATCALEDAHGHDDDHHEERARTTAVYAGEAGPELIVLPTSGVR